VTATRVPVVKSAGPGLFEIDYVRQLAANFQREVDVPTAPRKAAQPAAVRKSAPSVQRPLSPNAASLVADVLRREAERFAMVQKAVLAALPAAPQPKPAVRAVQKAKNDPVTPVYTQDGRLVGFCDPQVVTAIAQPPAAPASKPASGAVPDSDPRQPPAGTQLPQPGPAAAAAANPVADPSQPGTLPADDQDQADPLTAAVAKALASGQLDGLTAQLRKQAAEGTPREKQTAFDTLTALAMVKFRDVRRTGGQRQMTR
jgi:hypothetical protein